MDFKCDRRNRNDLAVKSTLLNQFKDKQKQFNKAFRQAKRQHENNSLKNLANLADKASNDPSEMWKRLKALSDRKSSSVLLEIIREDGSISSDKKEVLEKWCSDFKHCFEGMKDDPDLVFDDEFFENIKNLKAKFDELSNDEQEAGSNFNSENLNMYHVMYCKNLFVCFEC